MKTLNVTQHLHPAFLGDSTPNISRYLYKVTKVMDSIEPEIHDDLTKDEVNAYCKREDWKVVIS